MKMNQKHRKVVQHIKNRIDLGHDVLAIKNYLADKGLMDHEIAAAFDAAYRELEELEVKHTKLIDFFHPTRWKMLLPVLLIVFLLMHFFSNIYLLPELGENYCAFKEAEDELMTYTVNHQKEVAALNAKMFELDQKNIDIFKKKLVADFALSFTSILKLDPFFPMPCETQMITSSNLCYFTISEKEYSCIKSEFGYKTLDKGNLIVNLFVIFFEVYLIGCIISYYYNRYNKRLPHKTKEIIEFMIAVTIILLAIAAVLYYISVFRVITLG